MFWKSETNLIYRYRMWIANVVGYIFIFDGARREIQLCISETDRLISFAANHSLWASLWMLVCQLWFWEIFIPAIAFTIVGYYWCD